MRTGSTLLALATAFMAGGHGLASVAAAQEPTRIIRVGYLPATHDSLLFIAKSRNLFPPGLTVELNKYTSSPDILNDLRGEKIDIGIPGVAAPIDFIKGGAPFTIVGGAAEKSAAVVVIPKYAEAFKDKKLTLAGKVALFKGLVIGSVKQSTGDALFRKALKDQKLPTSTINDSYRDPKTLLSDLKGEKLDGAVLWSPHMTMAENQGMFIAMWMSEVLPNHVCCRQVVHRRYLESHGAEVAMYLEGLIRAKAFYDDAGDADKQKLVLDAVQKFVSNPPEVLRKELFDDPRTTVSVDLNEKGLKEYLNAMKDSSLISNEDIQVVLKSVDPKPLLAAYARIGASEELAKKAVDDGFERVKGELKPLMGK